MIERCAPHVVAHRHQARHRFAVHGRIAPNRAVLPGKDSDAAILVSDPRLGVVRVRAHGGDPSLAHARQELARLALDGGVAFLVLPRVHLAVGAAGPDGRRLRALLREDHQRGDRTVVMRARRARSAVEGPHAHVFIRAAGDHERVELTRDFLDAQHPFRVRDEALHLGDSLLGFPIGAADGVRGEVAAHAADPQVRAVDDAHARRGLVPRALDADGSLAVGRRPRQHRPIGAARVHDSRAGTRDSALRRVGKLGDVRDVEVVVVRPRRHRGYPRAAMRRRGGCPGDGSAGAERLCETEEPGADTPKR